MSKQIKKDIRYIVTSGPTREFFDPVRFLSNPSTGRMGYAIAKACINQGYEVCYIAGSVNAEFKQVTGAKNISIISTLDLLSAVEKELSEDCVLIMAAAPADYRPENKIDRKLKKEDQTSIKLVPNPDILKTMAKIRADKKWKNCYLIGFAAETHQVETYAKKKLVEKKLDMIFLNDISKKGSGFGSDTNELIVYRKDGSHQKWQSELKERLGYRVVNEIENSF